MKYGICLTPVYPRAIHDCSYMRQLIKKVRQEKLFGCAEIYFEGSEEEEGRIRKALAESGLESVYLGGLPIKRDGIDISSPNESDRKKGVEGCKGHIDHALRMGCSRIVIGSGPDWKGKKCREGIIRQMQKSLEELDVYTRGIPLEISVEPFPVKTEPWLAAGDTELVYDIFHTGNFRNVGITFDTSHISQLGEKIEDSFQKLKPWIHHIHLANCVMKDRESPLFGDKHPLFSQEGGDFTIETIRRFYQKAASKGWLEDIEVCSFEIVSRGNEDWFYEEVCKEAGLIVG